MHRVTDLLDRPVIVLLYHRVTDLESDPQQLAVSPHRFRSHMKFLKENVEIGRFEDDYLTTRRPSVVVTFDDGYADNALEALPILAEVGVPATFFVSTGTIGTRDEFWWDELERVVLKHRNVPMAFSDPSIAAGHAWPTGSKEERQLFYWALHPILKEMNWETRAKAIGRLRQWAGAGADGRESHRAMTVAELRSLAKSPWSTLGAHSVSHSLLSCLPVADQRREIEESQRQLEEWTGVRVRTFSYPFGGRGDFTDETPRLCRQAGIEKVAANEPGHVHRGTNPLEVPRYLVRDWPVEVFDARLREIGVCLTRR